METTVCSCNMVMSAHKITLPITVATVLLHNFSLAVNQIDHHLLEAELYQLELLEQVWLEQVLQSLGIEVVGRKKGMCESYLETYIRHNFISSGFLLAKA